jgi:Outer membrane protein beta-barrel domain
MIKPPILLAVLLLLANALFAQISVGVEGGLSYNSYRTNIVNRSATALANKAGFGFALPLRYKVYSWLYVVCTPSLVQKGYSMNRIDSLSGEYDQHNNTYVQLPIGLGVLHEWGRWRAGLGLGMYAGYWLYGRVKGNTADIFGNANGDGGSLQPSEQFLLSGYDQRYSFNTARDVRWEEGWWVGPELQYRIRRCWWLTAAAHYYQSLTSQEKAAVSPIPAYNRTWIFSVGGVRALPKPKSHI